MESGRWLAIDETGVVQARIQRCSRRIAEAIARVMLPELTELRLIERHKAWENQRDKAAEAPLLTPEMCWRQGITLPADAEDAAERLRRHFAGGGGGR